MEKLKVEVEGVAKISNIVSEKIVAERRSAQDQHGHGEDPRSSTTSLLGGPRSTYMTNTGT